MSLSPPVQITVPFATGGLKNAIPANANPTNGHAGYDVGFPAINMTPKTAGGIPPFGQDFNGIFFEVSTAIQFLEAGGSFPYSSTFSTAVGGYPLGALVSRTDGAGLWRNTVANNTTDPEAFGVGWQPEDAGNTAITMTNANITLTALQAARTIITITGVLTANLQLIMPAYVKKWLIVNNCTGSFAISVKTAAGSGAIVPSGTTQSVFGDGTNIQYAGSSTRSVGSSVTGLLGANNTGTPNTQFDFSANEVTLRDPVTGSTVRVPATSTITNNILTAGPAANGRDQAGAFTNGSWVHFHYIYNGAALATISSASATAPTLPTGYLYAAYAHSIYLSAGGALTKGMIRGSWFQNELAIPAVNNGNATGLTSVPLTAIIPPNALQFEIYSPNLALTALASGAYNITCNIVVTGTSSALAFGMQGTGAANAVTGTAGASKRLPNVSQNFAYQLTVGAGVGFIVTIAVSGYSVPNGGE